MSGNCNQARDERAAIELVIRYATALDARDWAGFRSLFLDEIHVDYGSLGSINAILSADDWVKRCTALSGFDGTLHKVTNFLCTTTVDRATVQSYVDAAHFLSIGDEELNAFACGIYRHEMARRGDTWKIAKVTFKLVGQPGGAAAFGRAFARAREIAGAR